MCGRYFKRKHRITKYMLIKHKHILFPGRKYYDSRDILQNPKVPKSFNNHVQRSTPPYYLDVGNLFGRTHLNKFYTDWISSKCFLFSIFLYNVWAKAEKRFFIIVGIETPPPLLKIIKLKQKSYLKKIVLGSFPNKSQKMLH